MSARASRRTSVADRTTVDATLMHALGELDGAVNYRRWILDLARPALAVPILEIGAGHGTFTADLAELGSTRAVEPDAAAYAILAERYGRDSHVEVTHGTIEAVSPEAHFNSVVMINVLEHIEDDTAQLRLVAQRLAPGGALVIWVPAFQMLYSEFDRELGHYRRYRKAGLTLAATSAGFEIDRVHYVNMPGWFSWLVITRLLRRRPTAGPLISIFDRVVVPFVRAVEDRIKPPFGQSILLVARKPAT